MGIIGLNVLLITWTAADQAACLATDGNGRSYYDLCMGTSLNASGLAKIALLGAFVFMDCCTGCCSNLAEHNNPEGGSRIKLYNQTPLVVILLYAITDGILWFFILKQTGYDGAMYTDNECDVCTMSRNNTFFGYVWAAWGVLFILYLLVFSASGRAERERQAKLDEQA